MTPRIARERQRDHATRAGDLVPTPARNEEGQLTSVGEHE
jgi:hypothetical protein